MKRLQELREKRVKLISDARALVHAAEKREQGKRDLTDDENRQFVALLDEARDLKVDIFELEGGQRPALTTSRDVKELEQGERELSESRGRKSSPSDLGGGGNEPRKVVLAKEHRFADEVRNPVYDDIERISGRPLSIGRCLRGIMTGNWRDAEAEQRNVDRHTWLRWLFGSDAAVGRESSTYPETRPQS